MINHIVHQAQDGQQRLKITTLIEIVPNGVAVLHHRKETNGLTILMLISCECQTKGNETNTTINQSQKDYFEKIQGCHHYNLIPSISELAALNPIEYTVEVPANKIEQYLMSLKR